MNNALNNLIWAQEKAMRVRPKIGGFPVFAEVLRQAGVLRNVWTLPSCQSVYYTKLGAVVQQGKPLISQPQEVPVFDEAALIRGLRADQAGQSTFFEFLEVTWNAGVIRYDVDFEQRTCTYFAANGEAYIENYPAAEVTVTQS